jgi:hypothetical protein
MYHIVPSCHLFAFLEWHLVLVASVAVPYNCTSLNSAVFSVLLMTEKRPLVFHLIRYFV